MELDDIWCVFTAVFERSNTVVLGQNKASVYNVRFAWCFLSFYRILFQLFRVTFTMFYLNVTLGTKDLFVGMPQCVFPRVSVSYW